MSKLDETFFTTVGCMDGRCQEAIVRFGQERFGATFADTITEAGLVGLLSKENVDYRLLSSLKVKIGISLEKHHSRGIVVHGHQECAALSGVSDGEQRDDVRRAVMFIKTLVGSSTPVVGVFVKRANENWEAEEVPQTFIA